MAWDIVKKITAMMAKAESTDSSAEAEAIMAKVHQMLVQHGITLLSISEAEARSADPVGTSRGVYGFWQSEGWMLRLSEATAYYYGVRIIWTRKGNYRDIAVVGRESCRAAFTAMMPYIRLTTMKLANQCWNESPHHTRSSARYDVAKAMTLRIWELALERQERLKTAEATGKDVRAATALVPVDEIQIELQEQFPSSKKLFSRKAPIKVTGLALELASDFTLEDQLEAQVAAARLQIEQGTDSI